MTKSPHIEEPAERSTELVEALVRKPGKRLKTALFRGLARSDDLIRRKETGMRTETADPRAQMASGNWFDAADAVLERDRIHAREVMLRFNADPALSAEERVDLLRGLFGRLGEGTDVSLGAQVDYGYQTFMGRNCFFNFNCTFLDGARIEFGDDVWVLSLIHI